jgi:hypothetical protein
MSDWRRACVASYVLLSLPFVACAGEDDLGPLFPVPYATVGDLLGVWDGQQYKPVFIKGVNLGVAVPGTQAGELAATREQYDRWFDQIGKLGLNAIRVYTLHYPRFYDAVEHYNRAHANAPLYVLHGVWLDEENPTADFFDMTADFDTGIKEVLDCAHGNKKIAERRGRAHGQYHSDISRWIIGWIIGREMIPEEVGLTNQKHAEHTSYAGEAVSLPSGTPLEAWLTERLDGLVLYERNQYNTERPVSVASWPTLDPLHHPSEDENSEEDSESLDFENIDTTHAPGGYFASYHAYAYYPDFVTRDLDYQMASDRDGPNSYQGYLNDLKRHYATHPLLIAEYGVPTSWGNAHYGAAHMNHGGENETEQGDAAVRGLINAFDAHCAGGAFFAWIDEWWKRTWIVDELAMPRDRYRLWHNITSPEQNFGLIEFDIGAPKFTRWPKLSGTHRIREIKADYDAEYFYVQLKLDAKLPDGETLTLGFDTYGDDLGESRLPDGTVTERRNEFALVFQAPAAAQLYVTEAYDTFGIWHHSETDLQLFHSVASDTGKWSPVRWRNNAGTIREGTADPTSNVDPIGQFVVRGPGAAETSRDGITLNGATIEVRVPWTLLQFADPSTRSVLDDDRATKGRETTVSDGVALSVELGGDLIETERFRWSGWEQAPATTERLKHSADILARGLKAIP